MRRLVPILTLAALLGTLPLPAQPPSTPQAVADKPKVIVEPPVIGNRDPIYGVVTLSDDPQTQRERFDDYMIETFGPKAVISPAFSAAIRMINPKSHYPREWKFGGEAFGRNYGDAIAAHTAGNTARYMTAALLHEDFRYRPSKSGNFGARFAHALAFTFVDRSDTGANRLAVANFADAAAHGLVGNAYLPNGYNDFSHAGTRAATAFAGLAGQNLAREFAPDLFKLARKLHAPFPRVPVPEWWVKRK